MAEGVELVDELEAAGVGELEDDPLAAALVALGSVPPGFAESAPPSLGLAGSPVWLSLFSVGFILSE